MSNWTQRGRDDNGFVLMTATTEQMLTWVHDLAQESHAWDDQDLEDVDHLFRHVTAQFYADILEDLEYDEIVTMIRDGLMPSVATMEQAEEFYRIEWEGASNDLEQRKTFATNVFKKFLPAHEM